MVPSRGISAFKRMSVDIEAAQLLQHVLVGQEAPVFWPQALVEGRWGRRARITRVSGLSRAFSRGFLAFRRAKKPRHPGRSPGAFSCAALAIPPLLWICPRGGEAVDGMLCAPPKGCCVMLCIRLRGRLLPHLPWRSTYCNERRSGQGPPPRHQVSAERG